MAVVIVFQKGSFPDKELEGEDRESPLIKYGTSFPEVREEFCHTSCQFLNQWLWARHNEENHHEFPEMNLFLSKTLQVLGALLFAC